MPTASSEVESRVEGDHVDLLSHDSVVSTSEEEGSRNGAMLLLPTTTRCRIPAALPRFVCCIVAVTIAGSVVGCLSAFDTTTDISLSTMSILIVSGMLILMGGNYLRQTLLKRCSELKSLTVMVIGWVVGMGFAVLLVFGDASGSVVDSIASVGHVLGLVCGYGSVLSLLPRSLVMPSFSPGDLILLLNDSLCIFFGATSLTRVTVQKQQLTTPVG